MFSKNMSRNILLFYISMFFILLTEYKGSIHSLNYIFLSWFSVVVLLFRLTEESLEEDEEETGGEEGGAAEESEGQQGRHPLSPGLTTTLNSSLQSWLEWGRVFPVPIPRC